MSLNLSNDEAIAVYAAMTHCLEVCYIYRDQNKNIKNGAESAMDKITAMMEERKLLVDEG